MFRADHLLLSISLLAIGALWLEKPAFARSNDGSGLCDVAAVQIENDEAGKTDRYYTGGIRLACVTSPPSWAGDLIPLTPSRDAVTSKRMTYAIGHSIYTPDDISEAELIEDDHPYAGWLYVGLGLEAEVPAEADRLGYLDNLELQLGVIGPLSGAEQAQRGTHDLLNATDPEGWGNQLDNEPGINLFYSRQWTGAQRVDLTSGNALPNLSFDMTPQIGLALGNIHIFGAGGLTLRLGKILPNDHGPSAARPSLPGSDTFPAHEGFSAYVFGGFEGRVVGRNIFLDGNSFQDDGPSVDKNRFVGEARFGLALTYRDLRLGYTHVIRSQEFEDQPRHTYGSATLTIRL